MEVKQFLIQFLHDGQSTIEIYDSIVQAHARFSELRKEYSDLITMVEDDGRMYVGGDYDKSPLSLTPMTSDKASKYREEHV